jgi:hypothetical protein
MIATPPLFLLSESFHRDKQRFDFAYQRPQRPDMSPRYNMARLVARANIETTQTGTYNGIMSPSRILIKKDSIAPNTNTAAASATPTNRGMPTATKIGIAMIPVVIVVVGLCVLLFFWRRKRRTAPKEKRLSISPPVPEKDNPTYPSSIKSTKRSSKVYTMNAFAAPIHDGRHRKAQFAEEPTAQPAPDAMSKEEDVIVQMTKTPRTSRIILEVPDIDSPTDRDSPFRLKRGDTLRRMSLGPELARLFPKPPTAAWMKPMNTNDGQPESDVRREETVYQQGRTRNQE